MPGDSLNFMQRLQEYGLLGYGWILILSIWAGTARYFDSLKGKRPTFFGWLTETCVSAFIGIVVAMICQYYELDYLLTAAFAAICGHKGTRSLYLVGEAIKKASSAPGGID